MTLGANGVSSSSGEKDELREGMWCWYLPSGGLAENHYTAVKLRSKTCDDRWEYAVENATAPRNLRPIKAGDRVKVVDEPVHGSTLVPGGTISTITGLSPSGSVELDSQGQTRSGYWTPRIEDIRLVDD